MFPISIDTSTLTYPMFIIPGVTGFLDGSLHPTVDLDPGVYNFQQYSGYYADFNFQVTASGTVDYDPSLDAGVGGFLGGRGSTTLKVSGFEIEVDLTALSHGLLPLMAGSSTFLMPDRVHRLVLAPASHYGFIATSGVVANFEYVVRLDGTLFVGDAFAGFARASTPRTLTITGYPINIDGRMLTNDLYTLLWRLGSNLLPRTEMNTLTLMPASGYGFQPGSGIVADFALTVTLDGCVDYAEACSDFLRGRGTDTLTILGYPVLVDAREADSNVLSLVDTGQPAQASRFLFGVLVPCHGYRLQTANGIFTHNFNVECDGRITVDPAVATRMVISTVPRVEIVGATPI